QDQPLVSVESGPEVQNTVAQDVTLKPKATATKAVGVSAAETKRVDAQGSIDSKPLSSMESTAVRDDKVNESVAKTEAVKSKPPKSPSNPQSSPPPSSPLRQCPNSLPPKSPR